MNSAPWDEEPAVILDNGSGNIKCGFAGEEVPRFVFPNIIATPKQRQGPTPVYVGDDALAHTHTERGLRYSHPMAHGIVSDWDAMARVWTHAYDALRADPAAQAVLLTEAPHNPTQHREQMAAVLFEHFAVPALQVQIQAVLALYAAGRTDGLVLDSGDGVTHVVPIVEGHAVTPAVRRLELAGREVTEWMMELLSDELQRPFTTSADREVARMVKERLCYVAQSFEEELEKAEAQETSTTAESFTLPDGETIKITRSRFCCPEILFTPAIAEKPYESIQRTIVDSVEACPIDLRRRLLNNVVLSGGNTMFGGMQQRLENELKELVNKRAAEDVHVVAANERKFSVWIGAAILGSLTSFSSEWITKQEYEENGPSILHKRCDSLAFVSK
ncbi:actin 2 [Trypanosoma theileri]|uniref:Actin 2 n=1 Tax=Trypanosoma theileri TaxID=67003 RepID=A0A1X0NRG7_9TRYP|nr:actin 2 [Trypanosoma theileri]XP_028882297.1 actin 2 [Trypanosoma theileri]ORC87302.1 actin 2 [Trypanosoma theileri]ORC88231.1 actin 2 [Trypanosoma theileri]